LPEAIRDGVTGLLIPPANVRALADAIIALLTDPARRASMSAAAARMPATDFSWDSIAERTERVYRDALTSRSLAKQRYSASPEESRVAPRA
jgi:glycosyltransferase involved in cell wall biosynthesis